MQSNPKKCPYFSLLIFSEKIITKSFSSGILQTRPVKVVWHQDGCCSPILSPQKVKNSGKLFFNKTREKLEGNFLGERLYAKR